MFRYLNIFSFFVDISLKLSLGLIFFNYGYSKLIKLINGEGSGLIGMVASIPFFGTYPVLFSWTLALTETLVIYLHIFVWGDNLFSHGPFEVLNTEEGKKVVFGQFLFIPISLYIIFNNRINLSIVNEK